MKRLLIGIGILLSGVLMFALLQWGYMQDKQQKQLLIDVCIEQGCSEAECKLFASFQGACEIRCSDGHYVKKW